MNYYITRLFEFAFSVEAAGLLLTAGAVVHGATRSRLMLSILFAIPIYVATFGKYRYIQYRFEAPIEWLLSYSRPLYVVSLALLFVALLFRGGRGTRDGDSNVPRAALLFFIFQLYCSIRLFACGLQSYAVLGLAIHLAAFACFSVRRTREERREFYAAGLHGIVIAGALFCGTCAYQLVMNSSATVWNNRFIGPTSNANHTAQFLAIFLIPTLYLAWRARLSLMSPWIYLLAFETLLFLWTGSRTGALMVFVGVGVLFRRKSSHLAVATIGIAIVLAVLAIFDLDAGNAANRLLATVDTRSGVFAAEFGRFLKHPIFGEPSIFYAEAGFKRLAAAESTYLSILGSYGLVGAFTFAVFAAQVTANMLALAKSVRNTNDVTLVDLWIAATCSILAGAMFEGYLLAMVGPSILVMYLYASLGEFLVSHHVSREASLKARFESGLQTA